jgi:hypothetical protein
MPCKYRRFRRAFSTGKLTNSGIKISGIPEVGEIANNK